MEQDAMFLGGGKGWQPITHIQSLIRSKEFIDTYTELAKDIYRKAGYSPQTFGFETSNYVQTGVSITRMERRTYQTMQKKERYWANGIKQLLNAIRMYGAAVGVNISAGSTTVDFADGASSDLSITSEAIRNLRQVRSMSLYSSVKLQHPAWTDSEVLKEVSRIEEELAGPSEPPAGRDMNFNQQAPAQGDGVEEQEVQDAE